MREGLLNSKGREEGNEKERGRHDSYRNIAGRRKRVNLKEANRRWDLRIRVRHALTVCEDGSEL
jgi:hypothetical protein